MQEGLKKEDDKKQTSQRAVLKEVQTGLATCMEAVRSEGRDVLKRPSRIHKT